MSSYCTLAVNRRNAFAKAQISGFDLAAGKRFASYFISPNFFVL